MRLQRIIDGILFAAHFTPNIPHNPWILYTVAFPSSRLDVQFIFQHKCTVLCRLILRRRYSCCHFMLCVWYYTQRFGTFYRKWYLTVRRVGKLDVKGVFRDRQSIKEVVLGTHLHVSRCDDLTLGRWLFPSGGARASLVIKPFTTATTTTIPHRSFVC